MHIIDDRLPSIFIQFLSNFNQVPNSSTVNETSALLSRKWQHITFGCRALDGITRNGLPIRGITEIVGESGSGKSQICLQMSLNVQLPMAMGGLQKSAVYICTEDAFPSKRLLQMTRFYSQKYQRNDWMDNIFIEHIPDSVCNSHLIVIHLDY